MAAIITHGLTKHPLFIVWRNMKGRCYNPKRDGFQHYGGRGIQVCSEWKNDFKAFYDWAIAKGWQPELQIDRKETNGNYEPDNCRFVTPQMNSNNRRNNTVITAWGITMNVKQWATKVNLGRQSINARIKRGWSPESALTTPINVIRVPKKFRDSPPVINPL